MYVPPHFREDDPAALRALVDAQPFATLVTTGPAGMEASHLPLYFKQADGAAPQGYLIGHLARPNGQAKALLEGTTEAEALAIFHGPQAYVSPSWYPSKREHGKVVPTWNYVAVHAYGLVRAFTEAERLWEVVRTLTERHEQGFDLPWSVDDAPAEFTQKLLKAIVGVEIALTRLEGKWKLSQNRPEADRLGVIEGLQGLDDPQSAAVARAMADREGGDG